MVAPNTFGVTAEMVRADFLPHSTTLSATTVPTASAVARSISQSAGYLQSLLDDKNVDTASISDSTCAAYLWCQAFIELRVAVRLIRTMSGQDPELTRAWVDELAALEHCIETQGVAALGPGASASGTSEAMGPTDHISEYSLDVGDTSMASSVEPYLRRDDLL